MWDIPGGPVVKILPSSAWGAGSSPGRGGKIPLHMLHSQKKSKQNNTVTDSMKNFKNGPHPKTKLKKKNPKKQKDKHSSFG